MLKVDKELEDLLLDKIKTLLVQGKSRQSIKKRKSTKWIYVKTQEDDFELVGKEVIETTDNNSFLDGVPSQIFDMLFQSLSTENAIDLLTKKGYLVIDPTVISAVSEETEGLTENAVNLIKSRILGIDS